MSGVSGSRVVRAEDEVSEPGHSFEEDIGPKIGGFGGPARDLFGAGDASVRAAGAGEASDFLAHVGRDAAVRFSSDTEPKGFSGGGSSSRGFRVEKGGDRAGRGGTGILQTGVVREVFGSARSFGKGPVVADPRKFRYDRVRAEALPALPFGATRADRMDAAAAGELLHKIHTLYGVENEGEDVIAAFDKALFFEHTINGASMMQPGRGELTVGASHFELAPLKQLLGVEQRRFFRAYADEIADVNREVLDAFDMYDPSLMEKHGQLVQVAVTRGLQKYPWLAHDSSDAGIRVSMEERFALLASKRLVLPNVENTVDKLAPRVPDNQA